MFRKIRRSRALRKTKISLLHAARGRPDLARQAREAWLKAAAFPGRIEHLFAIDADDPTTQSLAPEFGAAVVSDPNGCVRAWNTAAQASSGDILVQISDDWTPTENWDVEFSRRVRDPHQPAILRVSDGHRRDDLLCMAICTRARMEQQDGGEFLHSGYFGIYSDDEFSFRAYQDGVVIDARDLVFTHNHPNYDDSVEMDETYERQNNVDRDREARKLFLSRNKRAKGHWLHDNMWERFFVPIPQGERWDKKPKKA